MTTPRAAPPADFLAKLRHLLLPDEYGAFLASTQQDPHAGLRVNTLKLTPSDFSTLAPFPLTPLSEIDPAGFAVAPTDRPGRHPYHDAGLYYLQEPSAMVAATLLAPQPGEWVLDIAAAPGGKATHLNSLLDRDAAAGEGSVLRRTVNSSGLLVTNDVVHNRATILAANLARWGAANQLITADSPERLAAHFGPVFDRVLVDAPCSGEGMFRRQGQIEWSERMVLACATRQDSLLATAASLLRPGGRILYATCTFSPEENEQVIGRFLKQNPDFDLVDLPRPVGFDRGRPEWAAGAPTDRDLSRAVRLWPHRFPGEGHFLALMQRSAARQSHDNAATAFNIHSPARAELDQWHAFAAGMLTFPLPEERLHAAGGRLYLLPAQHPDTGRLRLVRFGVVLGELRRGYFRPSAELALALNAADTQQSVSLSPDDARLAAYLVGEDFEDSGPNGWVLVCVDGFGLGWAKRVDGRLKNHYPRSARRPLR